jgi:hypothetical protein
MVTDGLNEVPLPDLPPPPARGRTRTSGRNYLGARLRNWWLLTARSGNEVCATSSRRQASRQQNVPRFYGAIRTDRSLLPGRNNCRCAVISLFACRLG